MSWGGKYGTNKSWFYVFYYLSECLFGVKSPTQTKHVRKKIPKRDEIDTKKTLCDFTTTDGHVTFLSHHQNKMQT